MGLILRKPDLDETISQGPSVIAEPEPTTGDVWGAAFRTENIAGSWLATSERRQEFERVEGYNPYPDLEDKYLDYPEAFTESKSPEQTQAIKQTLDREMADRKTLTDAGLVRSFLPVAAATVLGPIETPTLFLTGAATLKFGSLLPKLARVGMFTGNEVTAAAGLEMALHETQYARTWQESVAAVGGVGLLSSVGGAAFMKSGIDYTGTANRFQRDLEDNVRTEGIIDPETEVDGLKSVGAAEMRERTLEGEGVDVTEPGKDRLRGVAPVIRSLNSASRRMRAFANDLMEHNFYNNKNARIVDELDENGNKIGERLVYERSGPAWETMRNAWMDKVTYTSTKGFNDLYVKYAKRQGASPFLKKVPGVNKQYRNDVMSGSEFAEEVGKAMRRGDQHEVPEIAEAASRFRQEVIEPVTKRFQALEILPEDLTAKHADSYFPRLYDVEKIDANMNDWLTLVSSALRKQDPEMEAGEAWEAAVEITHKIRHTEAGQIHRDVMPETGRTKERVLPVRDEVLEPYLITNAVEVMEAYMRSTIPEVILREQTGGADVAARIAGARKVADMDLEEAQAKLESEIEAFDTALADDAVSMDEARLNLRAARDDVRKAEAEVTRLRNEQRKLERQYGAARKERDIESRILAVARRDVARQVDKAMKALEGQERYDAFKRPQPKKPKDYRGEHTAPDGQDDGSVSVDNIEEMLPDFYGLDPRTRSQYYNPDPSDPNMAEAIEWLADLQGQPDKMVTIYRVVPGDVDEINPGDWVTQSKYYADMMVENDPGIQNAKIIEQKVRAGDLYWNGDSPVELGYAPKQKAKPKEELDPTLNTLLNRVRKGDYPPEHKVYGLSLLEALAKKGMMDDGFELSRRDLDRLQHYEGVGKRKLARANEKDAELKTLDDAAEWAMQEGYIRNFDQTELLRAIDDELAGNPVRSARYLDEKLAKKMYEMDELAKYLDEAEIDLSRLSNKQAIRKMLGARPKNRKVQVRKAGTFAARQTRRAGRAYHKMEDSIDALKANGEKLKEARKNATVMRNRVTDADRQVNKLRKSTSATKRKKRGVATTLRRTKKKGADAKRDIEELQAEANQAWRGEYLMQDVKDDYLELIQKLPDTPAGRKQGKALTEQMDRDLDDMKQVLNRFQYRSGAPKGQATKFTNFIDWARTMSFMANLGMMTVAAIPDIAKLVMENGLARTLKMSGRMLTYLNDTKLQGDVHQLRVMGVAVDLYNNGRLYAITGGMESMSRTQQKLSGQFSKFSLMNHWNMTLKTIAAQAVQDRILSIAKRQASGQAVSQKWLTRMARAGFEPDDLAKLAEMPAEKYKGAWMAKTAEWPDRDLAMRFELAVKKDADTTIVTPGIGDKPLFMDTRWGQVIAQFKSFFLSSHSQTLLPLIQKFSRGEVEALNTVITGVMLGIFVEWSRAHLSGREEILKNYEAQDWIAAGIDRSGLVTIPFEIFNMMDKATYGGIRDAIGLQPGSRFMYRNITGTLAGPVAGYAESSVRAIQNITNGEITENDLHSLRRVMPYQNLFYIRRALDKLETGTAEYFDLKSRDEAR